MLEQDRPPVLAKKTNSKSEIWNFFGFATDDKGQAIDNEKPTCRKCFKEILAKGANTSNLIKHLNDRHPDLFNQFKKQQDAQKSQLNKKSTSGSNNLPSLFENQKKYDVTSNEAKKINLAIAKFICACNLPVYTVEKDEFKNLLSTLNPKYLLPSRNYFMDTEIPKLYNDVSSTIRCQLTQGKFFATTTDLWTSRNMEAYMALTVHYISEDWKLHSWCISCVGLQCDHTAEDIREVFLDTLETWQLDVKEMSSVTTDNAANNKKAFLTDSEELDVQHWSWLPCFGHCLDLAIGKALDIIKVSATLSRLRKSISAITRSCKRKRSFRSKQTDLNLPLHQMIHDVTTRWNSTYDMVERFLEQQQAVCAVFAEDRKVWHLMPRDTDITVLETVAEVLGPLSEFTDALSGEKQTTASSVLPMLWQINSLLELTEEESSARIPSLASNMKTNISSNLKERYAENSLKTVLGCASYLDPRFKTLFVADVADVKNELLKNLDAGNKSCETSVGPTQPNQTNQCVKKGKATLSELLQNIQAKKKLKLQEEGVTAGTTGTATPAEVLSREMKVYEDVEEISAEDDPLQWWNKNSAMFPFLASAAKKFLCMAASSCASERVFSVSGLICSPRRNRLTQENLEMLVFLSKNLKCVANLQK